MCRHWLVLVWGSIRVGKPQAGICHLEWRSLRLSKFMFFVVDERQKPWEITACYMCAGSRAGFRSVRSEHKAIEQYFIVTIYPFTYVEAIEALKRIAHDLVTRWYSCSSAHIRQAAEQRANSKKRTYPMLRRPAEPQPARLNHNVTTHIHRVPLCHQPVGRERAYPGGNKP